MAARILRVYLILFKCGVSHRLLLLRSFHNLLLDKRKSAPHFLFTNHNNKTNMSNYESLLKQAEKDLDCARKNKETAISNGNYQNCIPNTYVHELGKAVNDYDYNIYLFEKSVKDYKAKIAEEKKKSRNKGNSSSSSSSSSKSSSSSSSSSSSTSYNAGAAIGAGVASVVTGIGSMVGKGVNAMREDAKKAEKIAEEVDNYEEKLRCKYPIEKATVEDMKRWLPELLEESKRLEKISDKYEDDIKEDIALESQDVADELFEELHKKFKKHYVEEYKNSLNQQWPIETASDSELAQWLPKLLSEIETQKANCDKSKDNKINHPIFCEYRNGVRDHAIKACRKLKEKNSELYNKPEVQEAAKKIDSSLGTVNSKQILKILFFPYILIYKMYAAMFKATKSMFSKE